MLPLEIFFEDCFRKTFIEVGFRRGRTLLDGSKSKVFCELDDPKKICNIKKWTYKSGVKDSSYVFKITKNSDLDYIQFIVKQKY